MIKRCISVSALVGIILAGVNSTEARQAVTTNLAGYWPMDSITAGSTPDASGANHPATQATAANQPTAAAGLFGGALAFDGTTDFLSVPDPGAPNAGSGSFTIAAWVKPSALNLDRLANKWNGTVGWVCDLNTAAGGSTLVAGNLRMRLSDGTTTIDKAAPAGLSIGAWTHVAVTVDRSANQMKFYANATRIGSIETIAGLGTNTLSNAAALGIGNIPTSNGNQLNAALDEVRYYSAALSEAQLLTLVQPQAPTGLTANPSTGNAPRRVDLSWTASAGSVQYQVWRSTTPGGNYLAIAGGITGTTYTDTDSLNYDTPYYYVVRGQNTVLGPNSTEAMATIVKPPSNTATPGGTGGDDGGGNHHCGPGTVGNPGPSGLIAGLLGLTLLWSALRKAS